MLAYAITNSKTLENITNNPDIILYRDKENKNYNVDAKEFLRNARNLGFKRVFLHGNYKLAHELKADGVHLRRDQVADIVKAKELGLFVVYSSHNTNEAKRAKELDVNMVTFSPIFTTPNKGYQLALKS